MLIDTDKIGVTFIKIFALEFLALGAEVLFMSVL